MDESSFAPFKFDETTKSESDCGYFHNTHDVSVQEP